MHIVTYSWVPLQYVLEIMQNIVLPAERKVRAYFQHLTALENQLKYKICTDLFIQPRIQGMVEGIVEHFWRVRGMPGRYQHRATTSVTIDHEL